jgi:hypothetical protein
MDAQSEFENRADEEPENAEETDSETAANNESENGADKKPKGGSGAVLQKLNLKKRIPLWGLLPGIIAGAGLVCGVGAWWSWSGSELVARRWKARHAVIVGDQYRSDVRPHPIDPAGAGLPGERMSQDWTKPHVSVYSVAAVTPPHPHPTLGDLAERGQARAIDFLAKDAFAKPHAWPELLEALNDGSEPGAGEKDPYRFDRVLVATVAKGVNWNPGDRMMWTRVFVEPINFTFAGYTVASTDNATVKVSSIEATTTRKFSADLGLTLPGLEEGPKASVGPSNERTIKTASDINVQYEKLGIDITPQFLRLIRESETGGDAVGNTKVSISVVTDPYAIQAKKRGEKHDHIIGDDLVLLVTDTQLEDMPDDRKKPFIQLLPQARLPHCPLRATVWMLYEQRQVDAGRAYFDEARQTISFVRDEDERKEVEIAGADDVSPAVWSLKICNGQCDPHGHNPTLQGQVLPSGHPRPLVFTDYAQAVKVAHWLRYQRPGVTLNHLKFSYALNDRRLGYPDAGNPQASLVPYKNTDDECANPDAQNLVAAK